MKAIIFDLDDTLYDENQFVLSAFLNVASFLECKFELNKVDVFNFLKETFLTDGREQIFNKLLKKYNITVLLIKRLVDCYRATIPDIELLNDSKNFLQEIDRTKFKLGIITDGLNSVQWNKINALNLVEKFDKIVVTDDHGLKNWKPSEFPYKLILDELKVMPENSIYIGDNANKDFLAPNELGMISVKINRDSSDHRDFIHPETNYNAQYEVNDLNELKQLLKRINWL
jgi:putative hydrolase of the HAD superfamily